MRRKPEKANRDCETGERIRSTGCKEKELSSVQGNQCKEVLMLSPRGTRNDRRDDWVFIVSPRDEVA